MDTKPAETRKKNRKRRRAKASGLKSEKGRGADGSSTASAGNDATVDTKIKKRKSNPLNGLILAISTLESKAKASDSKDGTTTSENTSYKDVSSLCESLGASTTAQVHNRVFAVICNKSTVSQSTQRVRKALKKHILIIDVEWVFRCKREGVRVDHQEYSLTTLAKEVVEKRQQVAMEASQEENNFKCVDVQDESDEEALMKTDVGWSEPVCLDCCCVCHDDDRDDCKWCYGDTKCNVVLMKLSKRTLS